MDIEIALKYMTIDKAIEFEKRRFFCNADEIINTISVHCMEKQIPYKLKKQDGDTGICKCGVVTEIIDEPFYCKYCGQRLCK